MTVHDRLVAALDKITAATSVRRVRAVETERTVRDGGLAELDERLEVAVTQLESAADALWGAIEVR
jgi:hypothetical protein